MPGEDVNLATYNLILTGTSSCLSIFGAFMIFVTYFKISAVQNFTRTLLIYLTLADLFTAVGNLVAVARYAHVHGGENFVTENCTATKETELDNLCVGQSFVTTISNLCSFLWTVVIAIHLWSSVVLKTRLTEVYYMHALYHVICWIIPFVIVSIMLHKDILGEDYCYGTGVWCGIRSSLPSETIERWMYIADIGWQMACYLIACFLYIYLKFHLKLHYKGQRLSTVAERLRNEDGNFIFVWMVIYLLKLWGFTRFFITTYVSPDTISHQSMRSFLNFLLILQSYGASGQAFWNFIILCVLDKTVRTRMKSWATCSSNSDERQALLGSIVQNSEV